MKLLITWKHVYWKLINSRLSFTLWINHFRDVLCILHCFQEATDRLLLWILRLLVNHSIRLLSSLTLEVNWICLGIWCILHRCSPFTPTFTSYNILRLAKTTYLIVFIIYLNKLTSQLIQLILLIDTLWICPHNGSHWFIMLLFPSFLNISMFH